MSDFFVFMFLLVIFKVIVIAVISVFVVVFNWQNRKKNVNETKIDVSIRGFLKLHIEQRSEK